MFEFLKRLFGFKESEVVKEHELEEVLRRLRELNVQRRNESNRRACCIKHKEENET